MYLDLKHTKITCMARYSIKVNFVPHGDLLESVEANLQQTRPILCQKHLILYKRNIILQLQKCVKNLQWLAVLKKKKNFVGIFKNNLFHSL